MPSSCRLSLRGNEVHNHPGRWQVGNRSVLPVKRKEYAVDALDNILGQERVTAHRTDLSRDIFYNDFDRASPTLEYPRNHIGARLTWTTLLTVS